MEVNNSTEKTNQECIHEGIKILCVYEGDFDATRSVFMGLADIITPEGEYRSAVCDWWQNDNGFLSVEFLKVL